MWLSLDLNTFLLGVLVFSSRVVDVSLGTMRTICIVQGRSKTAFVLGFFEVTLWLLVLSSVMNEILLRPVLMVFYALGFSTGNVVGIRLERKIGFGHLGLRIITCNNSESIAAVVRKAGYAVTSFLGEGRNGPVTELYIVSRRRDVERVLAIVREIEPNAFYITEQAGTVSKLYRPTMQPVLGWRAILKKK